MYHLMYQDHLAEPRAELGPYNKDGSLGAARTSWGHLVSRDFVKWARLPVAIWNDEWYARAAGIAGGAGRVSP
jgi:sucrose-6-phosphate hydrolase SacC (GH32 family)